MKKLIQILLLTHCLSCLYMSVSAQTYINILDNTYIRMTNGSTIYLNSSTPNTIIKTGSSGGFICQSENEKIMWNMGNSTGIYSIPFCSSIGNTIPFTYNITTAGTGTNNYIVFNSYETADNNTTIPTTVTGIQNDAGSNNSSKVIDRFWIIDPTNYTAKPKGTYTFTYDDNDLVGNSITEASLYAQRWNSNVNKWGDWLYSPLTNTSTNTVQIIITNPQDQYRVWTLVDASSPLPIELIRFSASCNGVVNLEWTTASETNNSYFTIQRSLDGTNFNDVTTVVGAGNNNQIINYSAVDFNPYGGTSYYRLKQTDFDGYSDYSSVVAVSCSNQTTSILNAYQDNNNNLLVVFNGLENELYTITLFDARGRQISETSLKSYSGENRINIPIDVSRGIYFINLKSEYESLGKKVFLY